MLCYLLTYLLPGYKICDDDVVAIARLRKDSLKTFKVPHCCVDSSSPVVGSNFSDMVGLDGSDCIAILCTHWLHHDSEFPDPWPLDLRLDHSSDCESQEFCWNHFIVIIMDTASRYASEECVSNDFFRHLLDDSQKSYLIQEPSPSVNAVELLVTHNRSCKHTVQCCQLSIWFTLSHCLDVSTGLVPLCYPEGMTAWVMPD